MEESELDDPIPVEETPGYVGHVFDGDFMAGEELKSLSDFDWSFYSIMADEFDKQDRKLVFKDKGSTLELIVDATSIEDIIGSLPSVEALYDCPPDQGPAGGSGYIFVVANGFSITDVLGAASALKKALDADFEDLRSEYQDD